MAGAALSFGFDQAHAAAPLAGKQNAGFYRYKVGEFEVTVVTDGVNRMKLPDTFVTNVKIDEVSRAVSWLWPTPSSC